MSEINVYVGAQIRKYRKACKLTMQELADAIHKSRATVCKYENGTISIDIETLYEISQVLQVSFSQLSSYLPTVEEKDTIEAPFGRKSPFFQAKRLYFYFYDGRYHRMKDGIIDISERAEQPGTYEATLSICSVSGNGRSNEIFGSGTSYNVSQIAAYYFKHIVGIDASAQYPTVYQNYEKPDWTGMLKNDQILYVGISQSGTSVSTCEVMEYAKK